MPIKKKKSLNSEQRLYEIVALFPGDGLEKDEEKFIEILTKLLTGVGAEIKRIENWGKRTLTYDINGQDKACFLFGHFILDSEQVTALTKDLGLDPKVIRSLITAVPEDYKLPESGKLAKEFLGWNHEPINSNDAELAKEALDKKSNRRRSGPTDSRPSDGKRSDAPAADSSARKPASVPSTPAQKS